MVQNQLVSNIRTHAIPRSTPETYGGLVNLLDVLMTKNDKS